MVEEGKYDRYRTVGMRQNLDDGMSTRERLESSNTVTITYVLFSVFFIFYYEKKTFCKKLFLLHSGSIIETSFEKKEKGNQILYITVQDDFLKG